jgi:hypothetical protein
MELEYLFVPIMVLGSSHKIRTTVSAEVLESWPEHHIELGDIANSYLKCLYSFSSFGISTSLFCDVDLLST